MSRFELAVRTTATASGTPIFQLHTAAGAQAKVHEIGLTMGTAVTSAFGVIRAASVGTASTSSLGQDKDPNDVAAVTLGETAWSVAPTIAGTPIYLRRASFPATIGAGIVWSWSDDNTLIVPVSAGLLIWNTAGATVGVVDVYISWEE